MAHPFVSYTLPGQDTVRIGVVADGSVAEIADSGHPFKPGALAALAAQGPQAMREAADRALAGAKRVPLAEVRLLPPVPQPGKIICLGLNYADHAAEGGNAKPSYPSFFMRGATSLIAHGAPLLRPGVSDKLDFEAELAVVIGKRARHLTPEDALSAVAGYACFNDATLRDYQRRTAQWTIGKNFDGTGAFGPWLVPADAVPPGASGLKIESRLNGRVMQSDNTSNMLFPVAETLCLLTEALTLEPGDVIAMGTPAGVGYARKPPVWMQPGDRIEIEIEGLGILANTVKDDA
ncbi:5-oxopent-3-ene-1,2,5-tricarboxylate decarboxylase [Pigmentiphaga sp. H8]|uniref:fumarylacetoacetate hydrolase family protein n=1 Tax=Pigmentiphaga sp. H8 TaxID=2488560 RepID=UPI000F592093|nr:fumarylacetoacetate hydrolase family protein [Pigmentiphaga sp. H8]AZG08152.1 5-oxopent-3-ene-1,2,5-tricarboxylate decarboxylase [Pigmentiphaga sp. H8]